MLKTATEVRLQVAEFEARVLAPWRASMDKAVMWWITCLCYDTVMQEALNHA